MTNEKAVSHLKDILDEFDGMSLNQISAIAKAICALEQPEIIYCKDCKHYNDGDCDEMPKLVSDNDFCSWGERRENETR